MCLCQLYALIVSTRYTYLNIYTPLTVDVFQLGRVEIAGTDYARFNLISLQRLTTTIYVPTTTATSKTKQNF